ncbi:hypothetical protein R1flu_012361 [Riccia fluitans]|uniref:Uncharacterized protein n=1 Tax=Riccia fluitans TaxID=41844 RepID=A0ABD1ZAF0_9MARC
MIVERKRKLLNSESFKGYRDYRISSHAKGIVLEKIDKEVSIRHIVISQVLELGIVAHSVIIGVSLGVSNSSCTIRPLFGALCFHQFFEGFALGGCISQITSGCLGQRERDRERERERESVGFSGGPFFIAQGSWLDVGYTSEYFLFDMTRHLYQDGVSYRLKGSKQAFLQQQQ